MKICFRLFAKIHGLNYNTHKFKHFKFVMKTRDCDCLALLLDILCQVNTLRLYYHITSENPSEISLKPFYCL